MEVAQLKLHLAHVMDMDLILRVHAAKTTIMSNVLGIHALIIMMQVSKVRSK